MSEQRKITVVVCRECRHETKRHLNGGCIVHECRCVFSERRLLQANHTMLAQRRPSRLR